MFHEFLFMRSWQLLKRADSELYEHLTNEVLYLSTSASLLVLLFRCGSGRRCFALCVSLVELPFSPGVSCEMYSKINGKSYLSSDPLSSENFREGHLSRGRGRSPSLHWALLLGYFAQMVSTGALSYQVPKPIITNYVLTSLKKWHFKVSCHSFRIHRLNVGLFQRWGTFLKCTECDHSVFFCPVGNCLIGDTQVENDVFVTSQSHCNFNSSSMGF